jgi:hypothetical protein
MPYINIFLPPFEDSYVQDTLAVITRTHYIFMNNAYEMQDILSYTIC